jgi:hypothetical protein
LGSEIEDMTEIDEREAQENSLDKNQLWSEENPNLVDEDDDIICTPSESSLFHLIRLLVTRALPVCGGFISMFLNNFISMSSAGQIGDDAIFAGISGQ